MGIILSIILLLLFATEFASLIVYGWWYFGDGGYVKSFIEKVTLNGNNSSIMNDYDNWSVDRMIHKSTLSLTSKWVVGGVGRIPRWSKLHKLIEEKHKELKSNNKTPQQ